MMENERNNNALQTEEAQMELKEMLKKLMLPKESESSEPKQ